MPAPGKLLMTSFNSTDVVSTGEKVFSIQLIACFPVQHYQLTGFTYARASSRHAQYLMLISELQAVTEVFKVHLKLVGAILDKKLYIIDVSWLHLKRTK